MRVGFIGLGDQGAPMAEMILRGGYELEVWARRPEATAPLVELGATARASVPELAGACEVVCICVVDDAAVEDVVIGHGLLDALEPGSTLLIHSTVAPATCERLGAKAIPHTVHVLDAPVSGGGAAARRGALAVMVGGDEAAFERVRPILATFGDPVRHVGALGIAQAIKLVNNGLFVANVAMADAAMAIGARLGVDPAVLTELLCASSGRSTGLEAYGPLTTSDWGRHAWSVLRKDVALLAGIDPGSSPLIEAATVAVDRFAGP